MKKSFFTSNVLPHIVAVLVFLAITIIIFHPIIFEGEAVNQHDILQGAGATHEILKYYEKTGEQALWTNSMFSGMPAYLIHVKWSNSILWTVQRAASFYLPTSARETFLAMLCFYLMLLAFGVRPYLAIAGAISFGLSTFFLISIEAGHMWKVRAISFIPLVIAGVRLCFRKKRILGFGLTSLAVALEIHANHLQMTYYLFLILLIYGLSELIFAVKEKKLLSFGIDVVVLAFAGILGIACNFGNIWATIEYGKYSTRGKSELTQTAKEGKVGLDRDYVFNWSMGIPETFTLLIPNFMGGASNQDIGMKSEIAEKMRRNNVPPAQIRQYTQSAPTYWGSQPLVAGPVYIGAIVVFLMVIGIIKVEKRNKIWLIIALVLSILLAWGKNFSSFNYLMYDVFPGYNKFRSVSFAITIALVCMPLLSTLGLQRLIEEAGENKKDTLKVLWKSGAITGGIALFFLMISGMINYSADIDSNFPGWFSSALEADRKSMFRADAFRSLFFVGAAFATIYFFLKDKISYNFFVVIVIALVFLDLWLVDNRYINKNTFERQPKKEYFQETDADKYILQDEGHYRVLNLQNPFNEARTSYFHSSIGGYHGAKLKKYQELIEYQLSDEIQNAIKKLQSGSMDLSGFGVLNMLNTKYIVAGESRKAVIKNNDALGDAWLITSLRPVKSADEAIKLVGQIDPSSEAVINESKFNVSQKIYSDSGKISLTQYSPNVLKYDVNASDKAFAVFSEIYYPEGWKAFVDGKQTDIKQVDYVLRGLEVPAGRHAIEFRFEPKAYYIGNKIVGVACYFMIFCFLGSIVFSLAKTKEKK